MNKEIIINIVREVLREAFASDHYQERLYDRFLNGSKLTVGYEIDGSIGEYEEVGVYQLPASIKQQILDNATLIEKYNFPKSKSFGIQLANIMIDKNQVQYFSDRAKIESKNKSLIFLDRKTESNGNLIYAIVRENELYTIYFAKNYVSQDASKLRVDAIIKNIDVIRQGKAR